jgi:hypothetical protein
VVVVYVLVLLAFEAIPADATPIDSKEFIQLLTS